MWWPVANQRFHHSHFRPRHFHFQIRRPCAKKQADSPLGAEEGVKRMESGRKWFLEHHQHCPPISIWLKQLCTAHLFCLFCCKDSFFQDENYDVWCMEAMKQNKSQIPPTSATVAASIRMLQFLVNKSLFSDSGSPFAKRNG